LKARNDFIVDSSMFILSTTASLDNIIASPQHVYDSDRTLAAGAKAAAEQTRADRTAIFMVKFVAS
jgi:hypothetical protein